MPGKIQMIAKNLFLFGCNFFLSHLGTFVGREEKKLSIKICFQNIHKKQNTWPDSGNKYTQ